MNINDDINRLNHAINELHTTEALIKAQRMELTVLRDERVRQRQILIDHVVQDILDQPDEYDIAEATEMLYGDGQTAAEAYLAHVQEQIDNFDIEQGADLS